MKSTRTAFDGTRVSRRFGILLLGVIVLSAGIAAKAQLPDPFRNGPIQARDESSAQQGAPNIFTSDRTATRRIELAQQRLSAGVYEEAVDLLQAVLEIEEDAVATSDDASTFRSLKNEASNLLAGMPPAGQQVYEVKYGITARSRLAEARKNGDWDAIESVSRQFFHTPAGREATYRLAIRAQDRGESLQAAMLFNRLQEREDATFEPELSLRAALAWQNAGMPSPAERAVERFVLLARDRESIGSFPLPKSNDASELLAWIRSSSPSVPSDGWSLLGGSVDRISRVNALTVAGGAQWIYEHIAPTEWESADDAAVAKNLSAGLKLYGAAASQRDELTQPAFHPIVSNGIAVFRTLRGLRAVDVESGEFLWSTEFSRDQLFDVAMEELQEIVAEEPEPLEGEDLTGLDGLSSQEYLSQVAWRNLTSGALSTDGRYVYGIEGVGLARGGPRAVGRGLNGIIKAVGEEAYNSLVAYDLKAEGRIAWIAGGLPKDASSSGTFFLGAPLPLGGRLYVLAEIDGDIRLLVLDPVADDANRVQWSQTLVSAEQPLSNDPLRRISGLSPSFSNGTLVCPTGAGAVVAIDLGQKTLDWGYRYQTNWSSGPPIGGRVFLNNVPAFQIPNDENSRWLDAVPRIADDAVFLTPRDSDFLHCVSLADGRLQWQRPRESMLYLATIRDGLAILVGRHSLVALKTSTGEQLWETPLPADTSPSGRGIENGEMYLVPLDSGSIASIRMGTGELIAQAMLEADHVPGNLVAADGRLLSLSAQSIVGFEDTTKLYETLEQTSKEQLSVETLALRGEDRLHRGEVEAGITDLQNAVANGNHSRARQTLVAALLKGLTEDFSRFRKFEKELNTLVESPQQRVHFYRLIADGLFESQDHIGAIKAYLRLIDDEIVTLRPELVAENRYVRSDRIISGRINRICEAAAATDRVQIDGILTQALEDAVSAKSTIELERLASFTAGTAIEQEVLNALLARYTEERRPLMAERVRLRFTGARRADHSAGSSTDESEPGSIRRFGPGRFKVEYRPDEIGTRRPATEVRSSFEVSVVGSPPLKLEHWKFEIDDSRRFLHGVDPTARIRWRAALTKSSEDRSLLRDIGGAQLRFSGHLMAFSAGTTLIVFDLLEDPSQPTRLWSQNLAARYPEALAINRRVFGGPRFPMAGPIGFAGTQILLYQSGSVVTAVDPMTGETFWQRAGLPSGCDLSGSDDVVVVQPPLSSAVLLYDALDGDDAGTRRVEEALSQVGWQGTERITWRQDDEELILSSVDVLADQTVWTHQFSPHSLFVGMGSEKCVVLDPRTGQLDILRWTDGKSLVATTIKADPVIDAFLPFDLEDRYIIFTHKNEPPNDVRVERDRSRFLVHGTAFSISKDGNMQWSTQVPRQCVDSSAPAGLPLLFLSAKLHREGKPPVFEAMMFDARTGSIVAKQSRQHDFLPFRFSFDPASRTTTILVPDGRFVASLETEEQPGASGSDASGS